MSAGTMPPPGRNWPRKVLVTGSSGFIGRHLTAWCRDRGLEVVTVSRQAGFDYQRDELPMDRVDHVFHLAGLAFVPESWNDPVSFYNANAAATLRTLEQCRQASASLTFASTYVYGQPRVLPVSESEPAKPNNPYAFSKLAGEDACRFYSSCLNVRTIVLRLFNVYGAGQASEFLVPTILKQVSHRDSTEVVVADLDPRRDYVHVSDVVEAFGATLHLPGSGLFNVGSGKSHSVREIIELAMKAVGVEKPYRANGKPRPQEIADVIADVSAISAACSWQPKVPLELGLQMTAREMR